MFDHHGPIVPDGSQRGFDGRSVVGRLVVRTCLWVGFGLIAVGCSAVETIPDRNTNEDRAFLKVEVEPGHADVYIDGEYRGRVEGWVERMIPVPPGEHRVKLEADGYISQRFDVSVESGATHTLSVTMEPTLEQFE